ncbi:MAG: class I SAM-dependent methyltransferase [Candidatus Levybacteria bacterium]|nr:class I SAM-dependent methyltransferase [Candidatus Levybacteria bacterium]
MKEKNICRCCKGKELLTYLNLGNQPLANSYHKGKKLPVYPLVVNLCTQCFHSQLSVVVNKERMFKNYLYVSGTTDTFRNHTKKLAEDAIKRFDKKNLSVLDIACNDGTQLEYFRDFGCDVMGVDPAENLRSITKEKNINVVVDYWTEKVADLIGKKFEIITGTNVFAHVNDLDQFLNASRIALKKNGLLILEFPYADKMIEHNEFDTVYHEHLSYFLVNSFATLAKRKGFQIVDVLQTSIHGGSIRFFLKAGDDQHCDKVKKLIKEEEMKGLLSVGSYKQFSQRVKKNKKNMIILIENLKKKNKTVVGYGASAKGNTMLNYFKLKLDYIVDDNELKWGYKTPGRNIPIVSPSAIAEAKDELHVVVLSWNFYNEIVRKVLTLKKKNVKVNFLLYVPDVKSIPGIKAGKISVSA